MGGNLICVLAEYLSPLQVINILYKLWKYFFTLDLIKSLMLLYTIRQIVRL